jgi:dipeptidyl-peptidase-4
LSRASQAVGFIQRSPINLAHQLQGNLLLIHGTGDDNCHYQTMELLINELIRFDKPFSMMAYPNRTHAISEGKNTTLHLRRLMTTYLEQYLPPGPR